MGMANFSDLLNNRRSIRDFEEKGVPPEIVKEIIRETCLAPSSGNGQPWKFIIVSDRSFIEKLSDDSKKSLLSDLEKNPASPVKKYEAALRDPNFNVFYNAPCLVFIAGSGKIRSLSIDCALAASYFMLSASDKGLGTCWIGLGTYIKAPELLASMGMTEDDKIVAPIILGYPKNIPEIPARLAPQILGDIPAKE
jgi:nitroreductase